MGEGWNHLMAFPFISVEKHALRSVLCLWQWSCNILNWHHCIHKRKYKGDQQQLNVKIGFAFPSWCPLRAARNRPKCSLVNRIHFKDKRALPSPSPPLGNVATIPSGRKLLFDIKLMRFPFSEHHAPLLPPSLSQDIFKYTPGMIFVSPIYIRYSLCIYMFSKYSCFIHIFLCF